MPRLRLSWLCCMACAALAATTAARAQLLGGHPLPKPPALPVRLPANVDVAARVKTPRIDELLRATTTHIPRTLQIRALLRDPSQRVALDPHGDPVLRGEFLATGLTTAQIADLQREGFTVERAPPDTDNLGLGMAIVRDTRRRGEAQALRALQRHAPGAAFTYQHLYLSAGATTAGTAPTAATTNTATPREGDLRIGLIDGGVDGSDPSLAHARIVTHGCARSVASRHGTVVASRLVAGDSDQLYVADLWCGDAVGGATSTLIDALAWMDREHVPVINISLVGPDNPLLARAVQAMIDRGHVLVAAVGNEGPAAPPLYPASYAGVIGVSGVDGRRHVLPESGAGPQVAFCALGVVGDGRDGRDALRGTSFASPIVARRAARHVPAAHPGAAAEVMRQLAGEAIDLGRPGRDTRYGYGLLVPQD
ncbi:S8 family serine peptidase [Dyella sp. KRB-257]|uniref:S8 family serine peptidase n=1 Tax=Dyella sp. KRB-257 TaxID=3400915 RepID=UPI003C10C69E